jgi:hypothetical protein
MKKPPRDRVKRPPRPPGDTKKRPYVAGGYEHYKAEWERHRNDPDFGKGSEWLTEPPALEVTAQSFLDTLNKLGNLRNTRRFTKCIT